MSAIRITLAAAALALAACGPGEIITEKAPFVNQVCAYNSLSSLQRSTVQSAKQNGFRLTARVDDREAGAFSFLLVKPGLNVIISGRPNSRSAYLTATAEGDAGPRERSAVAAVLSRLDLKC